MYKERKTNTATYGCSLGIVQTNWLACTVVQRISQVTDKFIHS